MNRRALHDRLIASGVDPDAFDVLGSELHPSPGELHVLRRFRAGIVGRPDRWAVYYSERGIMTGLREFDTEAEACSALLAIIGESQAGVRVARSDLTDS